MFAVDADHRQPVFVTRDALVSGQGTWLERIKDPANAFSSINQGANDWPILGGGWGWP